MIAPLTAAETAALIAEQLDALRRLAAPHAPEGLQPGPLSNLHYLLDIAWLEATARAADREPRLPGGAS